MGLQLEGVGCQAVGGGATAFQSLAHKQHLVQVITPGRLEVRLRLPLPLALTTNKKPGAAGEGPRLVLITAQIDELVHRAA